MNNNLDKCVTMNAECRYQDARICITFELPCFYDDHIFSTSYFLTKFDFKINDTKRKNLNVRKISVESKSFVERVVLNDIIESNRTSF